VRIAPKFVRTRIREDAHVDMRNNNTSAHDLDHIEPTLTPTTREPSKRAVHHTMSDRAPSHRQRAGPPTRTTREQSERAVQPTMSDRAPSHRQRAGPPTPTTRGPSERAVQHTMSDRAPSHRQRAGPPTRTTCGPALDTYPNFITAQSLQMDSEM